MQIFWKIWAGLVHTEVVADLIFLRLSQVVVQLDPVYSLSGESKELSAVKILS